ncbi:restriction endonuclease subunit S [Escherichia coli]|uniref:restriction endonuclease subunit S n=1 Tax=Escherichia coli TaxID=562 RepID=UPI000DE0F381|nr:restriction endonuclease subunit S [Escherichia coli]
MVPKGWTLGTLKDLADTIMGYAFRSEDFVPTGIPLLRMGNLYQNTLDLNRNPVYLPDSFKVDYKRFLVSPGDLVMSMTGTMGKRDYGFTVEIPSNTQCSLLNQRVLKIVPKNNASSGYILNLLRSELILSVLYSFPGGTKQANLSAKQLQELPVLIPPELEQKKIAQILSTWDKAISVTEKLLTNSQQQKKALMQQLLTGKKRLLDENGVRFSGEWEVVRLKQLIHEEKKRNRDNHIQRVLSVTNHSGFVLPEEQFSKRVASEDVSTYKIVKKNQYGYNPSRLNVGSFARLDNYDEGVLSPMYVVFSINHERLNSDYFLNWMSSNEAKQRIAGSTQGSVRDSVGFDALCSFSFSLPTLMEQQKIAAVLSAADAEMSMLEKKLACLKEEKKALMQQLLTGKRRVNVESEETVSA